MPKIIDGYKLVPCTQWGDPHDVWFYLRSSDEKNLAMLGPSGVQFWEKNAPLLLEEVCLIARVASELIPVMNKMSAEFLNLKLDLKKDYDSKLTAIQNDFERQLREMGGDHLGT